MTPATHAAFEAHLGAVMSDEAVGHSAIGTRSGQDIRLSLHHDLSQVEAAWRTFEKESDCTAFQTFDWLSIWMTHIGVREGVTPAIVMGWRGERVVCIFPLALEPGVLRRVRWLGNYLGNYGSPLFARNFAEIMSPERFLALWRDIQNLLYAGVRHDLIDLWRIPETLGAQRNPLMALGVTPNAADSYALKVPKDWEAFYREHRSGSRRRTDHKKLRRLQQFGTVEFQTLTDPAEVERSIDALIEQKRHAYAALGVANMFEWSGFREFFMAAGSDPKCRNLVHVSTITVGGTIAAASFGLIWQGRYNYVLAGYTVGEMAACSPGTIHLIELMRYCTQNRIDVFDFNIGDEPYKHEWLDTRIRLYDLMAPMTMRGRCVCAGVAVTRTVKRFLKRNPKVWTTVRKLRSALGTLRR